MIRFVNQVAEQVERTHPGIRIHTFAYLYCRRPPKLTRPRDNVIVRLCSIECCFSHPIRACRREHGGIDVQYGSAAGFAVAPANSLEDVLNIDLAARQRAYSVLEDLSR